jgi:hypothetical protein
LLDDSVTLDVGLSWVDPDTGDFQSEHQQLQRGSSVAIREFAPGSRFYARGLEIEIDAVDLGVDGAAVEPRRFCPRCGHSVAVGAGLPMPPSTCPRCGAAGIADIGQQLDTVLLRHVTAEVRRDQATITDANDERRLEGFEVVCTADIDPAHQETAWFATDVGLGCRFLPRVDLRWLNLGRRGAGAGFDIAGQESTGSLFRVCSGCGKLDQDAGRNSAREHRPWCRYRTSDDEHTVSVALTRELRTQAVALELPAAVTIGDVFAVPSLAAALLLGMRERMGGHPDHLQIEHVHVPATGSGTTREALLLHDTVPGGTGYLTDIATPQQLWDLLATAWTAVRDCSCRDEQRLACHRCLLPFARGAQLRVVSRSSAERHLRTLLGLSADAAAHPSIAWDIADHPTSEPPESHLEQRFRAVLIDRMRATNAAITETPGPWGNTVLATMTGSAVQWTLTPQVAVLNSKPDFLLQSSNTNIPAVAVFVDGSTYHASVQHNRLADDAAKRALLRQAGHVVLNVAEADEHPTPGWWSGKAQTAAMQRFPASQQAYDLLRRGPIDWLLGWMTEPPVEQVRRAAEGAATFMLMPSEPVAVADGVPLTQVGRAVLDDVVPAAGPRKLRVQRSGALVTVVEPKASGLDVALVLDDRPTAIGTPEYLDAWRQWHSRANALGLRDSGVVVTVTSALVAGDADAVERVGLAPVTDTAPSELSDAWRRAWESVTAATEKDLIVELAQRRLVPVPDIGPEGPDGIPLDLAWPKRRIAVDLSGLPDQDRHDLETAGWQVLGPDADAVVRALGIQDEVAADTAGSA